MNLVNLAILLVTVIGITILIYGKRRNDYVVFSGSILLVITISCGSFILLYDITNIVLSISTAILILGILLIIVELLSGIISGLGSIGVGLIVSSLLIGFLLIGISTELNSSYQKIENYEQCKIGEKYVTLYKDYKLITTWKPDNVYLETSFNAYNIELDDEVSLVIKKGDTFE